MTCFRTFSGTQTERSDDDDDDDDEEDRVTRQNECKIISENTKHFQIYEKF